MTTMKTYTVEVLTGTCYTVTVKALDAKSAREIAEEAVGAYVCNGDVDGYAPGAVVEENGGEADTVALSARAAR